MSTVTNCLKEMNRIKRQQQMKEFLLSPSPSPAYVPKIKVKEPYILPDINKNIVRHIEWATVDTNSYSDAIKKVFMSNGISYKTNSINQSVSMIHFALTLDRYSDYSKAVKLTRELQAAMDNSDVMIHQDGATISIEIPCKNNILRLGDVLNNPEFESGMTIAIGQSSTGEYVLADIGKLTHMLVAGASGSGKSVFIHDVILSLLVNHTPKDIELYLIDPKQVEFKFYAPLVQCNVLNTTNDAISVLDKLNKIMDARYAELSRVGCRDIDSFNEKNPNNKFRRIVLVIDELADLMMTSKKVVENNIVRLAQKSRACGIHMILSTQYPKSDVVTGLIKANIPTKVCFAVTSPTASNVMLGYGGAEKLTGKGDMLFQTEKDIRPTRIQAAFVEEREITNVVGSLLRNQEIIS